MTTKVWHRCFSLQKNWNTSSSMKSILLTACIVAVLSAALRAQPAKPDLIVSSDGTGDFKTVQEAIHSVPDFRKKETVILIKAGIYKEKLQLHPTKTKIRLVGENVNRTVITYDDFASRRNSYGEEMGTGATATFLAYGDDFIAENITFENAAGPVGQAVAVRVNGDRVQFINRQ